MKKFTKILSLALALALVLSTNAFAATTLYYSQDFSSYNDAAAVLADSADTGGKLYNNVVSMLTEYASHGKQMMSFVDCGIGKSGAGSILSTDASGVKWFQFIGNGALTGNPLDYNTETVYLADKGWNYVENDDEIYVVSYDFKAYNTGSWASYRNVEGAHKTLWMNAEGTTSAHDLMFNNRAQYQFSNPTTFVPFVINNGTTTDAYFADENKVGEIVKKDNSGTEKVNKMTIGQAYRMAATYSYKETLVDEVLTPLAFPHRETAVDGVVYGNQDRRQYSDYTTSDNPVLRAFQLGVYTGYTQALANLRMYTVGKNDAFTVARADSNLVPMEDASVAIKFSMPVAPTGDFSSVAIEGLTYGTHFVIADVKDVVNGNDVYSTAKVKFLTALDANKTYTVSFPESVTTEFGKAIAADSAITFTTEKAPTYNIALTANEGLSSSGTALTAATIGGKTVYFTATATNDTGRATNGALVIGIYDAEGNLVKYAFANKAFADAGEASFTAAFKVEAGQTAKAFVTGSNSVKVFGE